MKKIIFLLLVIFLTSCHYGMQMHREDHIKVTKKLIGRYDNCIFYSGRFMVSPSVTVKYIDKEYQDTNYICLYGKKCEFEKGEMIYLKHEFWNSAMEWKHFLVNVSEQKKYPVKQ